MRNVNSGNNKSTIKSVLKKMEDQGIKIKKKLPEEIEKVKVEGEEEEAKWGCCEAPLLLRLEILGEQAQRA